MKALDISNRVIGRRLGISEGSVRKALQNYQEIGEVADKPRSVRPKTFTVQDKNSIYRITRQDPNKSLSKIAGELNEIRFQAPISRMTISRALRRKGLNS
jgi:transposase